MQNTFKLLSLLRDKRLAKVSNEGLAELYQTLPSSSIIAEVFCKNIELINKINRKFSMIDSDERVSTTLQWIVKSLSTYKPSEKTKFSSYLYNNIKRRLMSLGLYYTHKERDKIFTTVSLNDPIEDTPNLTFADIIEDPNTEYEKINFQVDIENNKKLTRLEKDYCMEFLYSDFPDAKMVEQKYGLSPQQSHSLRKSIKTKLYNEMEI